MKVFDSFAWIEYFKGSKRAMPIKTHVDSGLPIYTPTICLTEIKSKYLEEGKAPKERIDFILERSLTVELDSEIALLASDFKKEFGLHTVDAIIYASSQSKGLPLVTGDAHFRNLPQVELI